MAEIKYTEDNFINILKKYTNYPDYMYCEGYYAWILERTFCVLWVNKKSIPLEEEEFIRKAYFNAYEVHGHFNWEKP